MGLRLASLALLLLALCRPAASTVQSWTGTNTVASSKTSIGGTTLKAELPKMVGAKLDAADLEKKLASLDEDMGNSIRAMLFYKVKKLDDMPPYFKKALANGVFCEFTATPDLNKKIIEKLYGSDDAAKAMRPEAMKAAKDTVIGECKDVATDNKCFCKDRKTLLYCLAEGIRDVLSKQTGINAAGTCRDAAIKTLGEKGFHSLKFDVPDVQKPPTAEAALAQLDEALGKTLCDASNPEVHAAIKAVYAADAQAWTLEAFVVAIEFAGQVDLDAECKKEDVKGNPVGTCTCAFEKGLSMCILQELANVLKEAKALDCTDPTKPQIDNSKKPDAKVVAEKIKMNKGGSRSSASAAATSYLLFAMLSAAAAVLLAH